MDDEHSKKLYLEYRALGEQVKQVKQFLDESTDSIEGLNTTIESLGGLEFLKGSEKMFAPIANGIFIEATLVRPTRVHMNVGDGVVVEKSIGEAIAVLEKQREQLERIRKRAQDDHANTAARMRAIEKLVG